MTTIIIAQKISLSFMIRFCLGSRTPDWPRTHAELVATNDVYRNLRNSERKEDRDGRLHFSGNNKRYKLSFVIVLDDGIATVFQVLSGLCRSGYSAFG